MVFYPDTISTNMAKECYRKSTEVESKSEKMIKISKNDLCWQISLGAIDKGFPHRWGQEIQLKRTYTDKGGQGLTKWECPLFVIRY